MGEREKEKTCDGDRPEHAKICAALLKQYPDVTLPVGLMMRGSKLVSAWEPLRLKVKEGRRNRSIPIILPYCPSCGGKTV